ncbi:hypothetical protein F7725_006546 [Dissostichus mawsoni]|uniref:RING-type domain-containing protein n=1 Tax=Dissostichus mawsoni TaxID=36200 RepID=A0A7J5XU71_DISMA|nr:hypothetical protein F7725_006546 [Dissostichus mawsoni]
MTHKEDLAVLEGEVQQITTNIQVTNQELGMFQQKLEEEVKKDQKEKRANQEGLKALKVETEDLVTQHRRYPTSDVEITRNSCRVDIQDVEKKISSAEAQYHEQLDQVKNGRRVSELIPVAVSVAARQSAATPPPSASHSLPSYSQPSAAAPHKPLSRTMESAHGTVFEKAMERLVSMFPDYKRPELMRFVQDLRFSSGGSLNNMALQDMLNVEDPCIICHEDMSPDDICVLECRHSFHDKCIRSWLKEQSTCPTCRDHALMPDDFPELSGRRRQAP